MEPAEITAGSVHLRPPRSEDVPALTIACRDPEIARWTRAPEPYGESDAQAFVTGSDADWAADRAATFCVLDSTTAVLLGTTQLRFDPVSAATPEDPVSGDPAPDAAALGYWVAADHRGRGVGRRAVGATCRWGLGALGLQVITWQAAVGNDGSRRLAERVGFTVEGTRRRGLVLQGGRHDCWIGSLLPGEVRA